MRNRELRQFASLHRLTGQMLYRFFRLSSKLELPKLRFYSLQCINYKIREVRGGFPRKENGEQSYA
jgi:hypothetical protein